MYFLGKVVKEKNSQRELCKYSAKEGKGGRKFILFTALCLCNVYIYITLPRINKPMRERKEEKRGKKGN